MPRIRYQVAASLDGCIAGPKGEYDWIIMDPDIDFAGISAQFDTFLVGRKTYEATANQGQPMTGKRVFVFSRTLDPADHPGVTIVPTVSAEVIESIRTDAKKDIWLFGGGDLFRSLLEAGLVDTVEVAVMPVLLGGGITLLPPPATRAHLKLTGRKEYETSGIVMLEYDVFRDL